MKTFATNSLGCKVNQYESQQIRQLLERLGLVQVQTADKPDLVVINTCCVTHTASAKSRQCIRKAQKLNPDAVIAVTGCLPTVQIGELNNSSKNIRLIRHRRSVAATLSQIVQGQASLPNSQSLQPRPNNIIKAKNFPKIKCKNKLADEPPELSQLTSFKGHTRAFLKIQDGCDGYCSYCIIPKARPYVQSKPPELVLQEAQDLVEAGHREIVVTGIFLGAYGQKSVRRKSWVNGQNDKLADLLDKMGEIPNLARIRLSSLEPGDVTPRLLDTFCKHPNIMPHMHLSLQSGSNAVLKRMCRQYNTEQFLKAVGSVKSRLDRPAITTDIIVGFPGETDDDFEATVDLAKQVRFAKMHIFSFSKRAGTAAASMQGPVNKRVIKSRSQILRDLDVELGYKFRQQFVGETAAVLMESGNGQRKGRSERYFMVFLEKPRANLQKGEIVRVKLVENREDGIIGQVQPQTN